LLESVVSMTAAMVMTVMATSRCSNRVITRD
jgi:hypothetical protein